MRATARIDHLSRTVRDLLCPPRCLACRILSDELVEEGLCHRCRLQLAPGPEPPAVPAGLFGLSAAMAYEGPALGLIAALKSSAIPAAAGTAAELIAEILPPPAADTVLVPVPSGRIRNLQRGIDPAAEIAAALAGRLGLGLAQPLRRLDRGHQRGRPRSLRIADPPRFAAAASPPEHVLLIDDVVTTGATLSACAAALTAAGTLRVEAAAAARTPVRRGRPGRNPT